MTAWQRLLAASSLAIGTAWDLITHPKTGSPGSGSANEVLTATFGGDSTEVDFPYTAVEAFVADDALDASIADTPLLTSVADTGADVVVVERTQTILEG